MVKTNARTKKGARTAMLILIKIAASGKNQCPCTKKGERAAILVLIKIAASGKNQCLHKERG